MFGIRLFCCVVILIYSMSGLEALSQDGCRRLVYDVESDRVSYYSDEKVFVVLRLENISRDTLTVRPSSAIPKSPDGVRYQRIYSVDAGRSYKMKTNEWDWYNWNLPPGAITYQNMVLNLEYHDRPKVVLERLPSGRYVVDFDVEIEANTGSKEIFERRLNIDVQADLNNVPTNSLVDSERISRYRTRMRVHPDSCLVLITESYDLFRLSENEPYRNSMLFTHYVIRLVQGSQDEASYIREIQHRVQIAIEHPDEILTIELLNYGNFPRVFDEYYCDRFPEIAATGDTRLHRYFREFVCKPK